MTNVLQTDYASPPARAGPRGRRRRQQGRTRQIREIREPLFFLPAAPPAAQRLSASANRLGNQMQRDREEPASSVSRSAHAHMQPPHRTGSTLCLDFVRSPQLALAQLRPDGPIPRPPRCPRPSRCPQGSLLAASVLGRYHGRTQFLLTAQHSTHMCRDDSSSRGAQSASSIVSPAFQTKLCTYVPACLPQPSTCTCLLHRVSPSASFHISPGHR